MEEITNRLGYRLWLTSADFNEQVRPGGLLNLTVNLTNSGFASLMNPRSLFVVLQQNTSVFLTKIEFDQRAWQPGESSFTTSIRLPSKMGEGDYNFGLWLPDEAETLGSNPLYAVQFANEGVWDEATGYNILGKVNVDSSVSGSYQRTEFMQVEDFSSRTTLSAATSTPAPTATVPVLVGDLISNVQISNDAENVILSFDYASGQYNAFQLFVDTDQNPNTGFAVNGIGAEALFENQTWNIYDGSGTDWKWQPTEVLISFDDSNNHASWNISRTILKTSQLDVVFQLVDTNWDAIFTTQKITYTIQ